MEPQPTSNNNPLLQTQSQVNGSTNSSYMFDQGQSLQLGGQFNQQQEPKISIKIVQPQQQLNQNNNSSLSFDEKLHNNNFFLTTQIRGQQVFKEFLVQLNVKQQLLNQAIHSILDQKNVISEPSMTICMFYLNYIYYYFFRNHEAMLSQGFKVEQISLIKTNYSFARHKKIIGINYQALLECNYAGKIRLLEILKDRLRKPQKSLKHVLELIGPCLNLVYEVNIPYTLRKVGMEMCFNNLEMAYSKIEFNELLRYFQKFMLANKIKLKPTLKDYLKIFECDQKQP